MEYGKSDVKQNYLCRRLKGLDHSKYMISMGKTTGRNWRSVVVLINVNEVLSVQCEEIKFLQAHGHINVGFLVRIVNHIQLELSYSVECKLLKM